MSEIFDPMELLEQRLIAQQKCDLHPPIDRKSATPAEADQWWQVFNRCAPEARLAHLRWLALYDLYFLLVYIFDQKHLKKQWHFDTIREMENNCDMIMDISTRGSGKSLKKTFGRLIQEILRDPDITVGIFAHNRPTAKSFLIPIKDTMEKHELLRRCFPDVIWHNPKQEAPRWSLESGIVLRRKSVTRPEATLEAWGLIDGLPTRKHYDLLMYDDIQRGPASPYMIEQIDGYFQNSMGLGAKKPPRWWMCGVFFRGGSIYENLQERGILARVRPAINPDGSSPIYTDEEVQATRKMVTPGVWACEFLVNPAIKAQGEGFEEVWLKNHDGVDPKSCNFYIVVDPGKGRGMNKGSKTSIQVIALTPDRKYAWVDGIAGPMGLIQRGEWTMKFHRQYHPEQVGYEHYGLQGDVEYIKKLQVDEGYEFEIIPLTSPSLNKDDRIPWLQPLFRDGEFLLPKSIPRRKIREDDEDFDLLAYFKTQEYGKWPATKFKDVLDSLSWIKYDDPNGLWRPTFPERYKDPSVIRRELDYETSEGDGSWMAS